MLAEARKDNKIGKLITWRYIEKYLRIFHSTKNSVLKVNKLTVISSLYLLLESATGVELLVMSWLGALVLGF